MRTKTHCLVRQDNEWEFEQDLRPGGILGLNHLLNKHVDYKTNKICLLIGLEKFETHGVIKFSKAAYTELGEDIYVSEEDVLIPIGWILEESLLPVNKKTEVFYLKIVKL